MLSSQHAYGGGISDHFHENSMPDRFIKQFILCGEPIKDDYVLDTHWKLFKFHIRMIWKKLRRMYEDNRSEV